MAVAVVEAGHRRVQVRQEGWVKGRADRDVGSRPVRGAVVACRAHSATFGAGGFAAVASVAYRAPVVAIARPRPMVGWVGRVGPDDVQQLVVVVEVVVAGGATLVG